MQDQPRRHRIFLLLLLVSILASVPFAFVNRPPVFWLGIPLWLWISLGATTMLALLTAWGIIRYWRDDRFE